MDCGRVCSSVFPSLLVVVVHLLCQSLRIDQLTMLKTVVLLLLENPRSLTSQGVIKGLN